MAALTRSIALALVLLAPFPLWADDALPEANEGSDTSTTICAFLENRTAVTMTQLTFAIHDVVTGDELRAEQTVVPNAKCHKVTLNGEDVHQIVQPGFCQLATTTVCDADGDCPAGQKCKLVARELHRLTYEYHFGSTGQVVNHIDFWVKQEVFWPFP